MLSVYQPFSKFIAGNMAKETLQVEENIKAQH